MSEKKSVTKSHLNKVIGLLEKKGIWSSIVGLSLAFPLNWNFVGWFIGGEEISERQLYSYIAGSFVAMGYLMLPSIIEIKSNLLTFTIKD